MKRYMDDKSDFNYRYTSIKTRLWALPSLNVGSVYIVSDKQEDGSYVLEELEVETVLPVWGKFFYPDQNIIIDPMKREITFKDEIVILSTTEWNLLKFLLRNQGTAVSSAKILSGVWDSAYRDDHQYLRVWISRVRKAIPNLPLTTIQGYGYRLEMSVMAGEENA